MLLASFRRQLLYSLLASFVHNLLHLQVVVRRSVACFLIIATYRLTHCIVLEFPVTLCRMFSILLVLGSVESEKYRFRTARLFSVPACFSCLRNAFVVCWYLYDMCVCRTSSLCTLHVYLCSIFVYDFAPSISPVMLHVLLLAIALYFEYEKISSSLHGFRWMLGLSASPIESLQSINLWLTPLEMETCLPIFTQ